MESTRRRTRSGAMGRHPRTDEVRPARSATARHGAAPAHGPEIDAGVALLVEALNRIGACTEASCEGHLYQLSTGERCCPCLPYVAFRAHAAVVDRVLEGAGELYYRPTETGSLHALWYIESCPVPEGGVLHTLTPHPSFAIEGIRSDDLAAAQQDARTLALFLLQE
jgi:hypothetical protein